MFGRGEIERLNQHKQLLILGSEANRLMVITDLHRLCSGDFWQSETSQAARRHPLLTAALTAGAGVLAFKVVRQPGVLLRWIGGMSGLGSALLSAWKLFSSR